MTELDLFHRLGVAIAVGALVGVERHWRERDEQAGRRTAGIRTFTLTGMLGATAGAIELALRGAGGPGGLVVSALFLAFAAAFAVFQYREQREEENFSVTSTVAAMLTFALGALALLGDMRLAGAAGVVLAGVLAARERLHGFMRALTFAELRSVIVLAAMSFVILPLVPAEPIGPFGGISPARIWLLAIFVAAISFAGYVAVKLLGERHGALVAGTVGGLLSSTAVTLTNARRAAGGEDADALAAGALGAGVVSYIRTAVVVGALVPGLVPRIYPVLAAAALAMAAAAFLLSRRDSTHHPGGSPGNPFDLVRVLQIAVLLAAIAFLAKAAAESFGEAGVIAIAALTGLGDVDAAVITAAGLAGRGLSDGAATVAILIGVLSNTLAKAAYGAGLGSSRFARLFAVGTAVAVAAGGGAYFGLRGFY